MQHRQLREGDWITTGPNVHPGTGEPSAYNGFHGRVAELDSEGFILKNAGSSLVVIMHTARAFRYRLLCDFRDYYHRGGEAPEREPARPKKFFARIFRSRGK